jgi:hypothetical protein
MKQTARFLRSRVLLKIAHEADWEAMYINCETPGCSHFICEHAFGGTSKILYSRDNPEEVGMEVENGVGCMNAGCSCTEYQHPDHGRPLPYLSTVEAAR